MVLHHLCRLKTCVLAPVTMQSTDTTCHQLSDGMQRYFIVVNISSVPFCRDCALEVISNFVEFVLFIVHMLYHRIDYYLVFDKLYPVINWFWHVLGLWQDKRCVSLNDCWSSIFLCTAQSAFEFCHFYLSLARVLTRNRVFYMDKIKLFW